MIKMGDFFEMYKRKQLTNDNNNKHEIYKRKKKR